MPEVWREVRGAVYFVLEMRRAQTATPWLNEELTTDGHRSGNTKPVKCPARLRLHAESA
jgi:hypothetical protein